MTHEANLRVGVQASPEAIFQALTDTKRLAAWWTSDTRGHGDKVGETLEFWFGKFCQPMKVDALEPGKVVRWRPTEGGMDDWFGTEISFTLTPKEGQTMVRFRHSGWKDDSEFFCHCSMKWATFLLSLKDLLETGKGHPAPGDVKIEHH
jgi:uncharacterized protein YndB with AHSA1/START domain